MNKKFKDYKIVFMGKTGVGKTSLINKMFGFDWETASVEECTKSIYAEWIRNDDKRFGDKYDSVMVMDTPGIAAALENDAYYLPFYHHALAMADCLVWVFQASPRYETPDQQMLQELKPYLRSKTKIVACVCHVDKLGEDYKKNWDAEKNIPNEEMLHSIQERCANLKNKMEEIEIVLEGNSPIACSSLKGYGIDRLLAEILQ